MTSDPLRLDPEFEALLQAVASDPESTLLRVPRPKVVRGFFEREEAVSSTATLLTRAERHLVQVHRNELAWLLRQACLYKLVEGPVSRSYVSRYGPSGQDCSPLEPAEVKEHLQGELGEDTGDEQRARAIQLLLECVQRPLGDEPQVADLAAASHRLQPTNQACLLAAVDWCRRSAPQAGLQLSTSILRAHPTREHATRAWECAGLAYAKLGRLNEAHQAYRRGCATEDTNTYMNRLVAALQVADREDAIECSRCLNDMLPGEAPSTAWFINAIRGRRGSGEWAPTRPARELARALGDKLDGVGRRIAHVLV